MVESVGLKRTHHQVRCLANLHFTIALFHGCEVISKCRRCATGYAAGGTLRAIPKVTCYSFFGCDVGTHKFQAVELRGDLQEES